LSIHSCGASRTTEASRATQEDADERLTFTVEEAAKRLGISRNFAYRAVSRGEIPSVRIGRRLLVPKAALEKLLAA
jgi:excisionase family DNA binding protein